MPVASFDVRLHGRRRQEPPDLIAQVEGIKYGGAADRVLYKAGNGERPGNGADGHYYVVVEDGHVHATVGVHLGPVAVQVEVGDPTFNDLCVRACHGQGRHNVAHFDDPSRHFREHGSEKHRVLGVYDRRPSRPEQAGRRYPAETAADDEDPAPGATLESRRAHADW